MAKQKLTIETKGFPTSISGLLGISNQFVNIPLDVIDEIDVLLMNVYNLSIEDINYVKSFKIKYRLSNDGQ